MGRAAARNMPLLAPFFAARNAPHLIPPPPHPPTPTPIDRRHGHADFPRPKRRGVGVGDWVGGAAKIISVGRANDSAYGRLHAIYICIDTCMYNMHEPNRPSPPSAPAKPRKTPRAAPPWAILPPRGDLRD